MSAKEKLLELVKTLDEADAKALLAWMDETFPKRVATTSNTPTALGAARGWSKKHNLPYQTTDEYMKAMREGEE